MASHQFLDYTNPVRDSYNPGKIFRGCSKAQLSLSKILHTISSFAPYETGDESSPTLRFGGLCCGKREFGIDLNLSLGLSPEIEEYESPAGEDRLSACNVVGEVVESELPELCDGLSTVEKSLEGECDIKEAEKDWSTIEGNTEEEEIVGEKATEVSEITNLQFQSFDTGNNGVCEETKDNAEEEHHNESENRNEGFLGLLIEAARLVSGEFEGEESEPAKASQNDDELAETKERVGRRRSRSKRKECDWVTETEWYGDFEEVSPVVRTKRGRNQVLPYRYRDSVMIEPWKRLQKKSSPKRNKR